MGSLHRHEHAARRARSTASRRLRTGRADNCAAWVACSQFAVRAAELAIEDAGLLGDPVIRSGADRRGLRLLDRQHAGHQGLRRDRHQQRCERTQRELLRAHDAAHDGGQHRHLLRRARAASFRRRAPARPAARESATRTRPSSSARRPDDRGRRRGAVPDRSDGVRYAVRDESPQRCSRIRRRVRTIAIATGSSSAKARRILVLEELEHAQRRGARIHAELVGFGTNSDGVHVTKPEEATMRTVMELALAGRRRQRRRHRLRERPRHGDRARRHRRDARDVGTVRSAHADQLAEELSRPHARRVRRAGGLVQRSR